MHFPFISFILIALPTALAVKFNLYASTEGNEYCLSQYISKDLLCTTYLEVLDSGAGEQSMSVVVKDKSLSSNQFYSKPDLSVGKTKFSFKTHEWADVEFCFTNTLPYGLRSAYNIYLGARASPDSFRTINLHVDTGAEAADYSEVKRKEKLTDLEVELLRMENIVQDLIRELEYLHKSEFEMRDINEDANERVKWFGVLSMAVLVGTGLWQIYYLQRFFKQRVFSIFIRPTETHLEARVFIVP